MKKQLHLSGMSRKHILLMLSFLMASSMSLTAQIYYEIHDARHNQSICGGDNYDGGIYHQPANGRLNAQWKFVHPNTAPANYFQIIDKKHGRALYAPGNGACGHQTITDTDPYLWKLEDVDGRGVIFKIQNKRGDYLTATTTDQNNPYTTTTSLAGQEQTWRLVFRQASGGAGDIVPTTTAGREIQNESETIFSTTSNQSKFTIYGLPRRLCTTSLDSPIVNVVYQGLPNPTRPSDQAFMNSFQKTRYGAMNQLQENSNSITDYIITFYVNSNLRLDNANHFVDLVDPFNSEWHGKKDRDSLKLIKLYNGFYSGQYKLNTWNAQDTFRYGTTTMLARFFIQEQNASNGNPVNNIYLQMPLQVSGIVDHEVPILGYTTEPQIPYLVLHDPPGDASISSFSQSKTICRDFEDTYASDQSNEAHLKVKIGVAGSAGLIVSTDFEFSVEFGVGLTTGDLVVKTNSEGSCINTNEGFSTSGLDPNIEDGSDVFIGYGYDLDYGKYKVVDFNPDSCEAVTRERLVYSVRGSGQDAFRKFVLTEGGIRNDIAYLQTIVDNSTDPRTHDNALYQINAWNRVLAANDSIVANATEAIGNPLIFNGGGQVADWSEAISVTQSSTLNTEHYLAATAGLETVLEFGGSGVSFGYNYNTEKRYGATQTQSGEESKVVAYSLSDDESGDFFKVDVLRDGRYGTPLFRVSDGTKSSCPYQGGYQRDQPRLKFANQDENEIEFHNLPVGQTKEIPVKLWNDSNEPRAYVVQLTSGSAGTDDVKMGAKSITGGDVYRTLTIPAHSYLDETLSVTNQTAHAYPNLIISMYPECDPAITSDIKVSVYFGLTAVNDESSPVKQLSVFPNPTSDELTADFSLEESADVQFELYDMLGSRIIIDSKEKYSAGPNRKTMNVAQVPSGIYQLAIKTNQSVISRKVIVQH